jgi:hypothetical protein
MSKRDGYLSGLYGRPTPLTGACISCGARVRLRKDGTVWLHGRGRKKPDGCPGSGQPPKPGTAKRKWPPSASPRNRSLRTVSGGGMESNRRRH